MSRFSLRYQAIDLSLGDGEIVAGRALECDLVLDDSLVSRRHALFRELADGIEVEDLGSRNGVLVNEARITGPTRLMHGDRVLIGSQQLIVKDMQRSRSQPGTAELARCPACSEAVSADAARCTKCGTAMPAHNATIELQPTAAGAAAPSQRPAASSFSVLAPLADKALGLGKLDEAERVLTSMLHALLTSTQAGGPVPQRETLATAVHYALRLAEQLQKPTWLDYPFELYEAAGQLMPAELIDELYRVASKVRYTNPRPIRTYVARMKSDTFSFGPADRFLLQRLEGLERRVVSG